MVVPLELDRRQAVYVGHAGTDTEGCAILSLVSVCGPANERDTRILLKLNARSVEGHFAIKTAQRRGVLRRHPEPVAVSVPTLDVPSWSAAWPRPPTCSKTGSHAVATSTEITKKKKKKKKKKKGGPSIAPHLIGRSISRPAVDRDRRVRGEPLG